MPCQACRRNVPTRYFEFYQGIGMLVVRTTRSVKGNLCRRCAKRYFWKLNSMTLLTGWWGMISFVSNIVYIINNVARYMGALTLPDGGDGAFPVQPAVPAAGGAAAPVRPAAGAPGAAATSLASYRQDIVLRLRGGQNPAEIAQFIAPRAGVSPAVAQQFIDMVRTGKA